MSPSIDRQDRGAKNDLFAGSKDAAGFWFSIVIRTGLDVITVAILVDGVPPLTVNRPRTTHRWDRERTDPGLQRLAGGQIQRWRIRNCDPGTRPVEHQSPAVLARSCPGGVSDRSGVPTSGRVRYCYSCTFVKGVGGH